MSSPLIYPVMGRYRVLLSATASTKSARIMLELGTLDRQLSDHVALPAAREFRDAYAAASASHG